MGLLRSVCVRARMCAHACECVCECVSQELRRAGRLAQIYYFCGGVSPRHHNASLVKQSLKHFVCPNIQAHAREKGKGRIGFCWKSAQESPFSCSITQGDPRGLLDEEVFRQRSRREDTCLFCQMSLGASVFRCPALVLSAHPQEGLH